MFELREKNTNPAKLNYVKRNGLTLHSWLLSHLNHVSRRILKKIEMMLSSLATSSVQFCVTVMFTMILHSISTNTAHLARRHYNVEIICISEKINIIDCTWLCHYNVVELICINQHDQFYIDLICHM